MTIKDEFELFTEQDYGPWLDRLTLHEDNGEYFLVETYGYSRPYYENRYKLSQKPTKTLQEAFGRWTEGAFCGTGKESLEEDLGVELTLLSDESDE